MKTNKIATLFDLLDRLFPRVKGVDAFSWNPRRETVGALFASIDGGRAELADLEAENARLRKGMVCPTCGSRDFHDTNDGIGVAHEDGRLFCCSECLVRAIRNEA